MRVFFLGLLFVFLSAFPALAAPNSLFGRFVGVLRHEKIQKDQLAKLDFIVSREGGAATDWQLVAVLTLHFGDFKSGEYMAYHFDNVRYTPKTNTFIFDQPDQEATILSREFSPEKFVGEFHSNFGGKVGKLILAKEGAAAPELPLIEPVGGEYRGKCSDIDTIVQLETYRSTDDTSRIGNPFASYRIKGQLGTNDGAECGFSTERMCLTGLFQSGVYNFYKERLTLFGKSKNWVCSTTTDGLICDGCVLKRTSAEKKEPRSLTPPTSKSLISDAAPGPLALPADITSLEGEYRGLLHHEYLDRYQSASMNLVAYQAPDSTPEKPQVRMSAVATLNFGDEDGAESLAYRFAERSYPLPLVSPQLMFRRSEADVDALLEVTQIGDGIVKGVWHSMLFGRVGTFELRKGATLKIPEGAKRMESLSAFYENTAWEIELLVGLGKSPPNTDNPFFPLTFGGRMTLKNVLSRTQITGGSYDFYTGKIGIEVGERQVFLGNRTSRERMYLKQAEYAYLAPLRPNDPEPYRFVEELRNGR